ncbi:MAG: phosphoglycerate mutase, partial [Clostridiales bacterium]|nr:phosphoglycerate mutase [Clostridiales bacterium]
NRLKKEQIEYKMLILPDHPTPISLKTHVSDPVPYVIYKSDESNVSGLSYNEKNAKETGIYIDKGHDLMRHFIDC